MRDNDLSRFSPAERAVALGSGPNCWSSIERQIKSLKAERRVSNAAVKRAHAAIAKLRRQRANLRTRPETTLAARYTAALNRAIERDIAAVIDAPAGGRTVAVTIGEPAINYTSAKGEQYSRSCTWRKTTTHYDVTLGVARWSALRAAGLKTGVTDGRLILSATPVYSNDRLTVLAVTTAIKRGIYDLRIEEDARQGRAGTRVRYLAVWRAAGAVEALLHARIEDSIDTLPRSPAIRAALCGPSDIDDALQILASAAA